MTVLPTHRCDDIRARADGILARSAARPVSLDSLVQVCRDEGIEVLVADLGDMAGVLRRVRGRWRAYLHRRDGACRRLCTLARLLGHFSLHAGRADTFVVGAFVNELGGGRDAVREESVEFAAHLLVPRVVIDHSLPDARPTVSAVVALASRCGVSPLAMATRLNHLGYVVPSPPDVVSR